MAKSEAGFSTQNLKHIRYWYRFYSQGEKGLQLVTQFEIVEKMIKSIPWGHNQRIAYKCKDINEAMFYVQKTLDNNWSRNVLEHQIVGKKGFDAEIGRLEQEISDAARSFLEVGEMTEGIWKRFVKGACVYPDGRIEVRWNFGDETE